jgi:hypothetical protein
MNRRNAVFALAALGAAPRLTIPQSVLVRADEVIR